MTEIKQDIVRDLMRVAYAWADEPVCPVSGRSGALEIAIRDALRASFAKSLLAEQGEPVAWQYRTRPDWEKDWQQGWMYCSKGAFEDYTRAPLLHDWHYEVRELFTHPVRPMSEAQIIQWMPVGLLRTEEFVYQKGIKDAEKFHGIKGATE